MPGLIVDERRRVTFPKNLVEPKQEFVAIKTKEGILLKSLPQDPIKAIKKALEPIKNISISEIKKQAHEEALKQAGK